jgi:hypothetical protein
MDKGVRVEDTKPSIIGGAADQAMWGAAWCGAFWLRMPCGRVEPINMPAQLAKTPAN